MLSIRGPFSKGAYFSISLLSFLMLISIWWGLAVSGVIDKAFLPSPPEVIDRILIWALQEDLRTDLGISLYRVTAAFFLSVIFAIPLSLLIATFKPIQAFFEPMIEFARYLPAVAFVPLILLWVGIDESAKISLIWIGTFFQMVLLLADDFRAVPQSQIEAAQTMGATRSEILQLVIIKSALPAVVDSLRITLGWAWTYLVVAEMVAANSGVGYEILKAQRYLQTETIFAGILLIGLLGLLSDQLFRWYHRHLFPWLYSR